MDADGKIMGFSPSIVIIFLILVALIGLYAMSSGKEGHPNVEAATGDDSKYSAQDSMYMDGYPASMKPFNFND